MQKKLFLLSKKQLKLDTIPKIIEEKYYEYDRKSKFNKFLYYFLRFLITISGILVLVSLLLDIKVLIIISAIMVPVATSIETILNPFKKWKVYFSNAYKLLSEYYRSIGKEDEIENILSILKEAEEPLINDFVPINDLIDSIPNVDK